MADNTENGDDRAIIRADFIQELIPAAERTALLYHLTFLSLGGFPKLELMIRELCIETQLLFGSSEALLMKCASISSNLVTSLFPILKVAVEENNPDLAVILLMKAKQWITDITAEVDDMVEWYEKHNGSVKTSTSDVYEEQKETEENIKEKSFEMKSLEDALVKFKENLKRVAEKIETNENQIQKTTNELNNFVTRFKKEHEHWTKKFIDCFRGYPDAMKEPTAINLNTKLKQLDSEKSSLRNELWNIKIKITDLQLQLANCKIRMGEIPKPHYLKEVQRCLSQIQQILMELSKFWKKVEIILHMLKDKTFVGEELVNMKDMEDEFLRSIDDAEMYWKKFIMACQRAHGIFIVQSKDAYKFLEIKPSSLSEEERKRQYSSIMAKLTEIQSRPTSTSVIKI